MLTLKTDKGARHYCSNCKAEMVVICDTQALFSAVCPNFDTSSGEPHDEVKEELPGLPKVQCPICGFTYKLRLEVLQGETTWKCRHCGHPIPVASPVHEADDIVQEALRIFGRPMSETPESGKTQEVPSREERKKTPSIITPCPTCGTKNRIPDPPRRDGIYRCGSCKVVIDILQISSAQGDG